MYFNPEYAVPICPLYPTGTNSTMFTQCCGTAICNDEPCCPSCGRKVIGWDAESDHERGKIRWRSATAAWKR
jgi:hypothetical protein